MIRLILFLSVTSIAFSLSGQSIIPFNLTKPDREVKLSKELNEISGLTWVDNFTVAAVQDEDGYIYYLNAVSGDIVNKIKFAGKGDYEGIEKVGNYIFIISSNGCIYQVDVSTNKAMGYKTLFNWRNDIEGLAFDSRNNRLLVACKEYNAIRADQDVSGKAIYAYDYQKHEVSPDPVLTMKRSEVKKFVELENKFKPSGLAIDPLTQNIYVVASFGKLLIVADSTGNILTVEKLKGKYFHQPEGICFSSQGDLYISNEGKDKKATLLTFLRYPHKK